MSILLGLFQDWNCSVEERQVSYGDTLALYTDGITESSNGKGEEFGESLLAEALRRHRELPPEVLLSSVVEDVRQFSTGEQQDDVTLIVAKCR